MRNYWTLRLRVWRPAQSRGVETSLVRHVSCQTRAPLLTVSRCPSASQRGWVNDLSSIDLLREQQRLMATALLRINASSTEAPQESYNTPVTVAEAAQGDVFRPQERLTGRSRFNGTPADQHTLVRHFWWFRSNRILIYTMLYKVIVFPFDPHQGGVILFPPLL